MAISANVTVAMPPEMVEAIEEQKPDDMSRAQYIRACIRDDVDMQLPIDQCESIEPLRTDDVGAA